MVMGIGGAGSNLRCLLENSREELVPGLFGGLYVSGVGWGGRIWKWVYWVEEIVDRWHWLRGNRFVAAVKKTHEAYHYYHTELENHSQGLSNYVGRALEGRVNEHRLMTKVKDSHAAGIDDWFAKVGSLFSDKTRDTLKRLDKIFLSAIPKERKKIDVEATVELHERVERQQRLIDLEKLSAAPIPFGYFAELCCGEELSDAGSKSVGGFVFDLKEGAKRGKVSLKPGELHRLLGEIVDHLSYTGSRVSQRKAIALGRLEIGLIDHGLEVLEEKDQRYIKEVQGYLPGTSLSYDGQTITLGRRVGDNKATSEDNHIVFEVVKIGDAVVSYDNACVAVFSEHSRAAVCMEAAHYCDQQKEAAKTSSIPLVEMEGVEQRGEFAIYQTLGLTPQSSPWPKECVPAHHSHTSRLDRGLYVVDSTNRARLDAFISILRAMVEGHYVFEGDFTEMIRYNGRGELRLTKVLNKVPFDWFLVEQWIQSCFPNNNKLYSYVMKEAWLVRRMYDRNSVAHPDAEKCYTAMKHILIGEDPVDQVAEKLADLSSMARERLKRMQEQANDFSAECRRTIIAEYNVRKVDVLIKAIGAKILTEQRRDYSPMRILKSETVKNQIVASVLVFGSTEEPYHLREEVLRMKFQWVKEELGKPESLLKSAWESGDALSQFKELLLGAGVFHNEDIKYICEELENSCSVAER
ncbi:hypothetical protein JYU14_00560 [Simkania negevensis]|uniref:Uncharacterized protein n=1 Tax=Simkania negevensis TaxID=83561 RepID=A0ABS3AQK2_9BACT|nr:hypothetical protein [Simkania negevensis]